MAEGVWSRAHKHTPSETQGPTVPLGKGQPPLAEGSRRPNGRDKLSAAADEPCSALLRVGPADEVENDVKLVRAIEQVFERPRRVVHHLVREALSDLGFKAQRIHGMSFR